MAKSPSITIIEKNLSAYTVTTSSTVLAVVGYATKGPIGVPTLVESATEFESKFGTSVTGSPYAALAVRRAFKQGNQIIFDRVATETGDNAAAAATYTAENIEPATYASMDIVFAADPLTTLTDTEEYAVTVTVDGTAYDAVFTASGTTQALSGIVTAINTAVGDTVAVLDTLTITVTSPTLGSTGSVSITAGDDVTYDNDLLAHADVTAQNQVAGTDSGASTDNIVITALEKGSSTDLISVVKSTRTNPVTLATIHDIKVYYDDVLKETFEDVSLTTADTNYFVTVITADPDNGGSEYITVSVVDNDGDDTVTEFQNGTYVLTGGADGFDDAAAEGDNEALFEAELATTADLANAEIFDYHILITPDMPEASVQDAAITLAEYRKDFIYIADSPMGLTYDEVIEWHNGTGGHGRTSALNSSFAATYWSWLKDYNIDTKEYVWCPPSVFVAEKYMEVDRLYKPWFAPAGDTRGKITAFDYEATPSLVQREEMYGDLNAVNPIVNFVSKGLEIYGQKTLLRETSALNRVSVRRMVIYAKKYIKKALESVVFEPHNADSWRKATNLITDILEPIRQGGGIDQYRVIIDDTTNTADVISQNIMKGVIKIIPTNTIEVIEITMQLHNAGASLDE